MTEYEQAILDAGIRKGDGPYLDGYDWSRPLLAAAMRHDPDAERFDRFAFVRRFAFAIPDDSALDVLAEYAPILEVGAGTGYWAYEASKRGVDILATDPNPVDGGTPTYGFFRQFHPVTRMTGVDAVAAHPDRTLLFVWPCYDAKWPAEVLDAYRGEIVIHVGEGDGGCTGDARFHRLLAEKFEEVKTVDIPQWFGIHDYLAVYRRRPEPAGA